MTINQEIRLNIFSSRNNRHFSRYFQNSSYCVRPARINSKYQANPFDWIVLLNAFIGPKPVKSNSNLSDNSTLKTTHPNMHMHIYTTHTHLHASIEHPHLQWSSQIQDIISTHAAQRMWHLFVVMENGNVCYHYLCILFAHMSLCPVVLSFWKKKSISAPCLFISMIFKWFYFRRQFINK